MNNKRLSDLAGLAAPRHRPAVIPDDRDRVLIVPNPAAGRRSSATRVGQLAGLLRERGYRVEVQPDLAAAGALAADWQQQGELRVVVGAGGDGTAAALVNALSPGIPVTLLPCGTENLLARYYRLPRNPAALVDAIVAGQTHRLDAGVVNDRVFLLMVSCGFDADVVRRLHQRRTKHISRWSYAKPILETIRSYQYPPLRIYCTVDPDSPSPPAAANPAPLEARWAFVFNMPVYALGLKLAPRAVPWDGQLDLCAFANGSLGHALWYLATAVWGGAENLQDYSSRRVTGVRIESDASVPFQADGDPAGVLPAEIRVLPQRLTLLLPPGARRHTRRSLPH